MLLNRKTIFKCALWSPAHLKAQSPLGFLIPSYSDLIALLAFEISDLISCSKFIKGQLASNFMEVKIRENKNCKTSYSSLPK